MNKALRIFILVVIVFTTSGCVVSRELEGPSVPWRVLDVPADRYGRVLRFPGGETIVQSGSLRFFVLGEEAYLEIPFEDDPRCERTHYTFATALPDGQLGFNLICDGRWPDRQIGHHSARYIFGYDWATGVFEQLVDEPLPYEALGFSWNPEMTRGVQEIGSLLGTISWLTPEGMEPMTITVGSDERSWSLDENLVAMYDDTLDNLGVGIARSPAWSPDGEAVAFWASTDAVGREGMARARSTYALFLLDPDTLALRQILTGVRNTGDPVWSPNSDWLLFPGDIGESKNQLWLVDAGGNNLNRIDSGAAFDFFAAFSGWNWLNDTEVVATRCLDDACDNAEILLYDVESLLQSQEN